MSLHLTKDSIDLGLVSRNAPSCVAFYRDVLGLENLGEQPMPGGTMHRLGCGTSVLKVISLRREPADTAPPGGLSGATGYRYWTLSVADLAHVLAAAEQAGHHAIVPPTPLRPGVTIAMLEDPDGNWVELLESTDR